MDEDRIVSNAALPAEAPKTQFKDDEIAGAAETSVEPFKHERITEIIAFVYNQWYTSSCVFHAFLTALFYLGVITAKEAKSFLLAYRKRVNYPNEGSIAYDAWDVIRAGVSPYADGPTLEKMTEAAANAMQIVTGAPVLKNAFKHFQITDYTRIADYVAEGKPVPVFIYATREEWAQEYVDIQTPDLKLSDAYVRHAVCIIPKSDFTENGVQRFAIHDSAKFGNRHLRYVSNEFIIKRSFYAVRIERNDVPVIVEPPVVDRIPDVPVQLNDKSEDVRALQRFLYDQGKLDAQYITGFYGVLTAKAVLWYQLEKWQKFTGGVPQILQWKGEYWGPQSIETIR